MKDWILDLTVLFSFDRSGFKQHCPNPLQKVDLSGRQGIVTGASSGIGLAVANIVLIGFFITLTIVKALPVRPLASLLLIPYLLWVLYATSLNAGIWLLNP